MITGCDSRPPGASWSWTDGRTVNALVLILMDLRHPLFEPDTSAQVIAPLIARASGPRTNAHPFSLEQALRKLGMHDASLDEPGGQRPRAVGRESEPGLA